MSNLEIDTFLTTFFTSNRCHVKELEDKVLEIQLTEEMDRAIMNRPFYWHYVKAMNGQGEPLTLRFYTDIKTSPPNAEWIHFGTPRMNDICHELEKTGRFVQAFQQLNVQTQTPLHPWLLLNVEITYKGMQLREEIYSLGLNLINGKIVSKMMENLNQISLHRLISPNCYTISPLIKLQSGYKRLEQFLTDYIEKQDKRWALKSIHLLKEELLLLSHFFIEESKRTEMKNEVLLAYERYYPEIHWHVINGGILYLHPSTLQEQKTD